VISNRMVPPACCPNGVANPAIIGFRPRFVPGAVDRARTYSDFGPAFAAEKLAELHGCSVSRETLRGWMIADGLWIDRRHRLASPHQPRRRRDSLGELVQIDGSEHAWFETRGESCTLIAFVDDATSRLMQLRFVASESAFDYSERSVPIWKRTANRWHSTATKHGIFRVNAKDPVGGDRITQFGRALMELNIDIICAKQPAGKGSGSSVRLAPCKTGW